MEVATSNQSPGVEPAPRMPSQGDSAVPRAPLGEADFVAIYEAEFDYVYHSLRRLGVRDADLEDLAHDVFVALYRGLADYDRSRPIRPWLFGIAFRVASDFRRRARHRFEVDGEGREFVDGAPGALEKLAGAEDRALVRQGLAALDLDRRAVFVMHDIDGHGMPEIAATLGLPLNTAYSRLRLAREKFAQIIRKLRPDRCAPGDD